MSIIENPDFSFITPPDCLGCEFFGQASVKCAANIGNTAVVLANTMTGSKRSEQLATSLESQFPHLAEIAEECAQLLENGRTNKVPFIREPIKSKIQ